MTPNRGTSLLDRAVALTAVAAIVLRWLSAGATATGTNLLVDLPAWIALAAWFAARTLRGEASWKFTGVEFGLIAFVIAGFLSALRASYKTAAVDQAMGFLAGALLFALAVQSVGRGPLLRIFSSTAFTLGVYALIQYLLIFPQTRAEYGGLPIDLSRRLEAGEVMATFFYPNTFGGYLALVLPLLAGTLLDSRRAGPRGVGPAAAALAACGAAMVLTGSGGAWAALGVGAVAFAALWATRERGRSRIVAAGLAVAILGAAAAAALLPRLAKKSPSLRNRQTYWTAAVRIFRTAPVLGVGLDNYQDYFPEFKPETPQEARKVHNDYLQILAETGTFGLLAFLSVLILGLRPALAREAAPPPPEGADPLFWPTAAAGFSAFLLAALAAGTLPLGVALALGVTWLLHFFLWRPPAGPLPFTRLGLAAGLAALLAHLAFDFDLQDRGVAATLFLALGLAAVLRGPVPEARLPRAACAAATGILLVISFLLTSVVAPRATTAESHIEKASAALGRFEGGFQKGEADTSSLSEALRSTESAQVENPLDPEGYLLHARAQFHFWDLMRRGGPATEASLRELQVKEETALLAIDKALHLRPRDVGAVRMKVEFHREFRRFYAERAADFPSRRDGFAALAASHLDQAVILQRRALRLYPTLATNSCTLARLLDLLGEGDEAAGLYGEALRLHGLAATEKWSTGRLELPPLPLARALKRTGRPFDAHEALAAHARRGLEGLDPAAARARLGRLRGTPEAFGGARDEADDLMRPVLGDAVDGILGTLPR
jgi:O-antigen ligase